MGATHHTYALPAADSESVRQLAVRWLQAKGFEQISDGAGLFPFEEEDDRGLVIAWNERWTTVAYSHWFQEGERLAFELKKASPLLLEVWVYDSDLWGYRLLRSGRLVASFNSKPRYFGGPPDLELPANGDPRLLCEALGQPELAAEVARLQRRWAVFSETIAERFCQTLGVRAAAASYQDFADAGLSPGRRFHAGSFEVEMLRFRRGSALNAPPQNLQILGLNVPPTPEVDPRMAELQAQLQRQLLPLTWFLRYVIGPPMRIVGWVFITWLRLSSRLRRHRPSGIDAWWQELIQPPAEDIEQDGTVVRNRRYGCQITLPEGMQRTSIPYPQAVFHLKLDETHLHCDVIRPNRINDALRLQPGSQILADERLSVGELPARIVWLRVPGGERSLDLTWHFLQTPQAVYRFHTWWEVPPTDLQRQRLRELLESFLLV